ncbi:2OG-Fe(II) oxygenase [Dickeya sp. CFBP 2040]|uniref:2OG-Fe(II) oxygenase n=1 Tax=Dickeya sp. CFBP 2040 TaxID=2718531 RepID=UPI001447F61D|nr:2OG-Fe(II) oxygenase [Dickeya sp. CFBP 2040]
MGNTESLNRLHVTDEALPEDVLEQTLHLINNEARWEFGSLSDREGLSFGHWNQEILQATPRNQQDKQSLLAQNPLYQPVNRLWKLIQDRWLPEHKLVRCYVNAHTYGIEGYPHTDSRSPGHFTTLIYLNKTWRPEWAGETVFFNHTGDIIQSVIPRYGRLVIFDGRTPHAARSLSRRCGELRQTLVLKSFLPPAESDAEASARRLIQQYSGDDKNSYGYSVADHCLGLYAILKNWQAEQPTLSVSLFYLLYLHALTAHLDMVALRQKVTEAVGHANETMIYDVAKKYQTKGGVNKVSPMTITGLTDHPPQIYPFIEATHPYFNVIIALEVGTAVYTNTLYKDNALCKIAKALGYLSN